MSLRPFRLVLFTIAALLLTPSVASAAWTVTPTPNGPDQTSLYGVDCSSANSCIAVGDLRTGGPVASAPIVERWDGTSWQIVPTPNPPGATFSSLYGVSCPRPNVCFAVGSSGSTLSASAPLIELWNGTSWSIQPRPPNPQGLLEAVSCSGLLACTAVGFQGATATSTLAERWDGAGWQVQSAPNLSGAATSDLYGVSCPLRRTCTAVGSTNAPASLSFSPLVERWFGRVNAWALQAAPKPEGAERVSLDDVSCPNGRVCVIVGSSGSSDRPLHPGPSSAMAARRIGLGSWSIFPLTTLPGPASSLSAVDCPVLRFCQATGFWGGGLIAERFDGASWQVEGVPTNGLQELVSNDVSCPSRFFCMAVGEALGPAFTGVTLAAKWTP